VIKTSSKIFINWIFGVLLVYSILFGTGKLIFKEYVEFLIYLFISILSFVIIFKNLSTDKY
jgi:Na+/proline symporter